MLSNIKDIYTEPKNAVNKPYNVIVQIQWTKILNERPIVFLNYIKGLEYDLYYKRFRINN